MATAHAKLGITDLGFDAVVGHLVATLAELEVPNKIIADIGTAFAALRADIVSVPASRASSKPSVPKVSARSVTSRGSSWMASLANRLPGGVAAVANNPRFPLWRDEAQSDLVAGCWLAQKRHVLVQCLAIDFTVSYAVRYESSGGAVGDIRWATRSPGNSG